MSFRENLLQKIEIDRMAKRVIRSMGAPGSEFKVDLATMRRLLETGGYEHKRVRDLDLYVQTLEPGRGRILVLDNGLALYDTTVEDVALRKSPTVKEMVSIRNAIRILNDKDVVVSKKDRSVEAVRQLCVDSLDLSFTPGDIEALAADAAASLANGYQDGVVEGMDLFGELLGLQAPPGRLKIAHCKIMGALTGRAPGAITYGPVILFSRSRNAVALVARRCGASSKADAAHLQQVAGGSVPGDLEGAAVFDYLKSEVLQKQP